MDMLQSYPRDSPRTEQLQNQPEQPPCFGKPARLEGKNYRKTWHLVLKTYGFSTDSPGFHSLFFRWTNPVTTWRFPRGTPVVTMRFNTKPCSYDLDDDWVYPQPETITFPWTSRRRTPRTVPQFVSEVGGNNSSKLWVYGRYIEQDGAPSRASDRVQLVYVCGWMNYGLW